MSAPLSAMARLEVPFHDVDPMGIVWHGHYLKYFEAARTALFDSVGVDLFRLHAETGCVFPIIRSSVKHIRPLKYRDLITCDATLVEARVKLVLAFEIRLVEGNTLCATGRTEQAAVKLPDLALQWRIPDELLRALGEAPPTE